MTDTASRFRWKDYSIALCAMIIMVVASNILVQYPIQIPGIEHVLTWGAISYPFIFLVTDLSSRRFGPSRTRRIAYTGFIVAVLISILLASPRIALASGCAFLCSQLVDIFIFSRMNQRIWWLPPFIASFIAAAVDTFIFFFLAFYCGPLPLFGTDISALFNWFGITDTCLSLPWASLAMGDFVVKVLMNILALGPYGYLLSKLIPGALSPAFRKEGLCP